MNNDFMKHNAHGDNAPVVNVSWHDAKAFIDWLNKTDGGGYRLPSEAEWEYACRAGGQHKYCGSNNVNSVAWHTDNCGERPRRVAGKQANTFGLYDMSGNVYEWVEDCWHDSYRGAPSDGSVWTGNCKEDGRGLRGGSWDTHARITRAADRNYVTPGYPINLNGFRLARTS